MKYIDCIDGCPEEMIKTGYYFQSDKHICKHFIIEIIKKDYYTKVNIYETKIPQSNAQIIHIDNGEEVKAWEVEDICSIKLLNKYFYITYPESPQYYYDDIKYYKGKDKTDEVLAVAECINFAIELGIKKTNMSIY